jgi:hypothetical protein
MDGFCPMIVFLGIICLAVLIADEIDKRKGRY